MMGKVLVAGIGNVFLGDDGFGVEVAARLRRERVGGDVRVLETGIRARDLAYELLDGDYEVAILIDAVGRGEAPGTVSLIEPLPCDGDVPMTVDAHAMTPDAVLRFLRALGGVRTRLLIVGCEPESVEEGMGLTPPVASAVDEALALIRQLLADPTRLTVMPADAGNPGAPEPCA